ncbi:MAG TPA: DinB family protein [Bryobacteraceae bacterium]|nr:DinB family protein [Bryobacteraceae bacterium]
MKPFLLLSLAAGLAAQTFDPKMPAGVPEVSGPVVELAAMRYIDVKEGSGPAAGPGQQYTVQYTGWLRDGKQFDSSVGKDPIQFAQGRRQVIAGWEMGFQGMKVGGKRRLFIPYQLAYGEQGRGPIPPKAELVFDVELLGVKDAPEISPAADLVFPLNETQDKLMQLAKAIPADKYDWRPAPGVRSFKEVFLHIAYGTRLMMHAADGTARDALIPEIEQNSKAEQQLMTKEQVIAALSENLDAYRRALESARAGSLSRDVDFFGTATTRRAVLADIDTHIAEHLGQAIAYARMNGVVPPWSK